MWVSQLFAVILQEGNQDVMAECWKETACCQEPIHYEVWGKFHDGPAGGLQPKLHNRVIYGGQIVNLMSLRDSRV